MSILTHANFDLLIDRSPAGYRAPLFTRGRRGDSRLRPPLQRDNLTDFLWHSFGLSRHLGALLEGEVGPHPLDARDFGQRLFDAVFAGGVGTCLRRSLDKAQARSGPAHPSARRRGSSELADLPWEYLFAADLNRFLALSDETPWYATWRWRKVCSPCVTPPLTLLAIIANPSERPSWPWRKSGGGCKRPWLICKRGA